MVDLKFNVKIRHFFDNHVSHLESIVKNIMSYKNQFDNGVELIDNLIKIRLIWTAAIIYPSYYLIYPISGREKLSLAHDTFGNSPGKEEMVKKIFEKRQNRFMTEIIVSDIIIELIF